MNQVRRNILVSVPALMGVAGCSTLIDSEAPSLQILIFNASEQIEPLEYTITKGDSTFASGSLQVAPTSGGNHHTLQSNAQSLQPGDELEIEVRLPEREKRADADVILECSDDCTNAFTIRVSQGSSVSVTGIN